MFTSLKMWSLTSWDKTNIRHTRSKSNSTISNVLSSTWQWDY